MNRDEQAAYLRTMHADWTYRTSATILSDWSVRRGDCLVQMWDMGKPDAPTEDMMPWIASWTMHTVWHLTEEVNIPIEFKEQIVSPGFGVMIWNDRRLGPYSGLSGNTLATSVMNACVSADLVPRPVLYGPVLITGYIDNDHPDEGYHPAPLSPTQVQWLFNLEPKVRNHVRVREGRFAPRR